jgi:hypothetical protein
MTEHEKAEFWNGLARLYDETLALKQQDERIGLHLDALAQDLRAFATEAREGNKTLRACMSLLMDSMARMMDVVGNHEQRIVHLEGH